MCPLCGLYHSIRNYNPDNLQLDILAPQRVGLGRGRGSKILGYDSLLGDDDVTPKIVNRVVTLCSFFLTQKLISQCELKQSLGMRDAAQPNIVSLKEYNRLLEEVDALKVQGEIEGRRVDREAARANNLRDTANALRLKVERLETELSNSRSLGSRLREELDESEAHQTNTDDFFTDLINTLEERTKFMFDSGEDSRESFITEVVEKLLEDLEALKADTDE
jgi:hypothetical protein